MLCWDFAATDKISRFLSDPLGADLTVGFLFLFLSFGFLPTQRSHHIRNEDNDNEDNDNKDNDNKDNDKKDNDKILCLRSLSPMSRDHLADLSS